MGKKTFYAGIELAHPIIAASTGKTNSADKAVKCEESGYSAIVLKSVQEEVLVRGNPLPRFAVLRSGIPGFSSTTFYSREGAYKGDIDHYAETVYQSKKRVSIPVIASINCINPETWGEYAIACEQAGADAIEIVPTCPTGLLTRDSSNDINSISIAALKLCKEKVKIPVIPKMGSQMADVVHSAVCLSENGADALTMIARTTGIEIDTDTMTPILSGSFHGHGGAWALNFTLRWIISVYPIVKAQISATGGITKGDDVIKCLLAGASSVQIGTIMYLKGYDYVQTMLKEIDMYMERKNINNLSDIIGIASKNFRKIEQTDRVTHYYATVNTNKCVNCRQCKDVCNYDALSYPEKHPVINMEVCDGCGLCASICQKGAIDICVR